MAKKNQTFGDAISDVGFSEAARLAIMRDAQAKAKGEGRAMSAVRAYA